MIYKNEIIDNELLFRSVNNNMCQTLYRENMRNQLHTFNVELFEESIIIHYKL